MQTIEYLKVSQVLSPFSGLHKIDPNVVKNAAERGTRAHNACAAIIKKLGHFPGDDSIDGYVESFSKWYKKELKFQFPDRFYCNELMITGECDGIYTDENGSVVLYDLKTPQSVSRSWKLQLSAYAYLARKAGYDVKRIEIIKLNKTGKEAKVIVYEEDFETFCHCLHAYRYFDKNDDELTEYLENL